MTSKDASTLRGLLRRIGANAFVASAGALLGGGTYIALHLFTPHPESRETSRAPYYQTCREALQDGRANIRRGEPGYRPELDADGDGLACEPYVRLRR